MNPDELIGVLVSEMKDAFNELSYDDMIMKKFTYV
jgi:hypothetical protein